LASVFADRHGTDELIRACEETLAEIMCCLTNSEHLKRLVDR